MAEEIKKEESTEPEAPKEKEFSKRTTQLIALSALVLAICATFSSLKAGAFSSKAILAQNAASNGWAYYQAKSLKENTYKVQIDHMKLAAATLDPEETPKLMEKYQKTVDRYKAEEKEIMADARAAEERRDKSLELNKGFAGALTFLQIAILLTSLAALVKQIWFWYAGLAVGAVGIFNFVTMMMQTF
ncbi:MAG: DUF4337 domain-containing protein [Selenomonadaceae bacterium]|nr:DUF4337 domain-containing protein [Selenomonadaceae bacterium]